MKKPYRGGRDEFAIDFRAVFWSMAGLEPGQDPVQDPQQEGVATKAAEKLDDVGRKDQKRILERGRDRPRRVEQDR